jgi:hypothetical protein
MHVKWKEDKEEALEAKAVYYRTNVFSKVYL